MSEWTSLSCKEDTKERFTELKGDRSQDEFLQRLMELYDDKPEPSDAPSVDNGVDTDVLDKLDRIEERLKDFSVTQNQERVISRIDDHETEIKTWFEREFKR